MSLLQKLREHAAVIVVTVVIVVLIVLAIGRLRPNWLIQTTPPPGTSTAGDDDAPIIIAGGSMYISTDEQLTATFSRDSDRKKLVYTKTYKVSEIDLMNKNDTLTTVLAAQLTQGGRIDMCDTILNTCSPPAPFSVPKITLLFEAGGNITIEGGAQIKVGRAVRMLPFLWTHREKGWTLRHIDVHLTGQTDPPPVDCGPDGDCDLKVHTCTGDILTCKITLSSELEKGQGR